MTIAVGIIALLLIQYPLARIAGERLRVISRDYAVHSDPFGSQE